MSLVTVDGQPVHFAVAAAFARLDGAFHAATKQRLRVTSGHRSTADQTALFLARYRIQASGNGPFGDVRWWNGKRYVRASAAGTVAQPGTSLHESFRALDIRDTGADAGVTSAGTVRSNWIKTNAHQYEFNPNGFTFREPWHIEFTGSLTTPAGGNITPIEDEPEEEDDNMRIIWTLTGGGGKRQTAWFVGPNGIRGIPNPRLRGLLSRVIADKEEKDNFLDGEIAEMAPYFAPPAVNVTAGAIDYAALAKALISEVAKPAK